MTAPAVIAPLTFTAVRPLSIRDAMEISSRASAIGRFSVESTTMAANLAPAAGGYPALMLS